MSGFELTSEQATSLQNSFNVAEIFYNINPAMPDIYKTLYEELISYIRDGDGFRTDVDPATGAWIAGAKEINAGNGLYSVFIREYTLIQYKLRNGEDLQGDNIDQKASNEVARNFFIDLLHYNEITQNYAPGPYTLPPLEEIGLVDAGAAASEVFDGAYAPWA